MHVRRITHFIQLLTQGKIPIPIDLRRIHFTFNLDCFNILIKHHAWVHITQGSGHIMQAYVRTCHTCRSLIPLIPYYATSILSCRHTYIITTTWTTEVPLLGYGTKQCISWRTNVLLTQCHFVLSSILCFRNWLQPSGSRGILCVRFKPVGQKRQNLGCGVWHNHEEDGWSQVT